jgi:hypothetical protein
LNDAVARGADGAAIAQARAQLTVLARLQRRVADASPVGLASMRGEVTATVAATQAITLQGAPSGAQPYRTAQVALERASAAARLTTTNFVHAFYDEHEFDKYLRFASTEDEQEYRRREDERKQAIQKALDEHTPEGNLRAANLSLEQLHEAGAHGANRSPEYAKWDKDLTEKRDTLARGIDNQKAVENTSKTPPPDPLSLVQPNVNASPEALAALRAAGVVMPEQDAQGHGVTFAAASSTAIGRH